MTTKAKPAAQWDDEVWVERYGLICPPKRGKIVTIHGVGDKDTYNPALYEGDGGPVLAFRCEARSSNAATPVSYHPSIAFARPDAHGIWRLAKDIEAFGMMEDPFVFYAEERGLQQVVFGGVWVRNMHGTIVPRTEFYKGDSLETLERIPFAVVDNMKDVRLLQLPDDRLLICRRPQGDKYVRGRITLHVIDTLDQLVEIDKSDLPVLAILDSCQDALDWVGVNSIYMLKDSEGRAWVGLLGHVALEDHKGTLHYAVCTYRIALHDLLGSKVHKVCPHIIATRSCFEDGPAKTDAIRDVVFPGHLQHIDGYTYRLWAGLSDARIGCLELEDPFHLRDTVAEA